MLARTMAAVVLSVATGCSGGNAASSLAKPPEFTPEGQTKCGVRKSQARPLIVEWPSADRGDLEAQAKGGLVAVRYLGCEMEVLSRCAARGNYGYTAFTRKDDRITIRDADDLYANVPLGAAKLEAKLAVKGELNVTMTIVGKYIADSTNIREGDLVGDCAGATHVVASLTVGAFEFFAGADAEVGAGATVGAVGAGARSASQRELLNRDGDKASCEKATGEDKAPPYGCGALLRVEVVPLVATPGAPAAPAVAAQTPAPRSAEAVAARAPSPPAAPASQPSSGRLAGGHPLVATFRDPPSGRKGGGAAADEALYQAALQLEYANRRDEARKTYYKLITEHPDSKLRPSAYAAFGDMFFDEGHRDPTRWPFAEQSFKEVIKYPAPDNYVLGYAHHRLAQVVGKQYAGRAPTTALDQLRKAILHTQLFASSPGSSELARLARADILVVFAEVGVPAKAHDFLKPLMGDSGAEDSRVLEAMVQLAGRYKGAGADASELCEDAAKRMDASADPKVQARVGALRADLARACSR